MATKPQNNNFRINTIGFVGLGKLGLPVALSIENKGYKVAGYDINPEVYKYVTNRKIPYQEQGTPELLKKTKIKMLSSIDEVVRFSDIIFVPIQTPHDPRYEGVTRLPKKRIGFDYSHLKKGITDIAKAAKLQKKHITLVVISTVLPGTMKKEVRPLLNKFIHLCYNPFFIAMGTTREDFENPEFVLLGCDDELAIINKVKNFYATIHDKPVFETTIINAEMIKVIYNTYVSSKIAFINTVMEISHKMGANVDAVSDALSLATIRIISPKYMRGGMGDGGGCHPRDNIALSWLARELDLSYDYFEHIMIAREKQTEWLANLLFEKQKAVGLPIVILGKAFKKDINLTVGSPSLLLKNILKEKTSNYRMFDPLTDKEKFIPYKAIYFIGINHEVLKSFKFPIGSFVLDPWGIIKKVNGVEVIRIGRQGKKTRHTSSKKKSNHAPKRISAKRNGNKIPIVTRL